MMFKKIENNILFIIIVLCLSIGTLFTVFAEDDFTSSEIMLFNDKDIDIDNIENIALNKVIIVGDSRMEFLLDDEDVVKPVNFIFDVKSGAGFDWFQETGEPKLREILDNRDFKYHYHVVFNLGVNDVQYNKGKTKEIFDKYIGEYEKLILEYDDVDFYFLSINPIDEDLLNKSQPYNIRTNDMIERLNEYFENKADNSKDFVYCDSYHALDFGTDDGIHYNSETSQNIIYYIARDCINY